MEERLKGAGRGRAREEPAESADDGRSGRSDGEGEVRLANESVASLDSRDQFYRTLRGGKVRDHTQNFESFQEYEALLARAAEHISRAPILLHELEKIRSRSSRRSKQGVNFDNRAEAIESTRSERRRAEAEEKALSGVMRFHPTLKDLLLVATGGEAIAADVKNDLKLPARQALAAACGAVREIEAPLRVIAGEIAVANHGLVARIAPDYYNRGLIDSDVQQEGMLGLLEAVQRFDYKRGFELSTYADWWIKQRIERAIKEHSKDIRIPAHLSDTIAKVNRFEGALRAELGRAPTPEEIADESDIPLSKVISALKSRRQIVSLQDPLDGDGNTVAETVEDENAERPDRAAAARQEGDKLDELLQGLTERERTVLEHRFGLNGQFAKTLEEVGKLFKVTRERIRQIEAKGLKRLRGRIGRFGGRAAFTDG